MDPIKLNLEPLEDGDLGKETESDREGKSGTEAEVFKVEKESAKEKGGAEKDDAYSQIMSKLQSVGAQSHLASDDLSGDAEIVLRETDADSQITNLVDIAMNKGVVHAVKVAKHLEDNYILDSFHDKLMAEELHDALVKKGLLRDV